MENRTQSDAYADSCLHIEYRKYFFAVKGTAITFTKTEFRLLSRLIRGINAIVTFEDLWDHAWGPGRSFKRKSIHVLVSRVRRKLAPFGVRIDTVVGVGYILSHGSCCKLASQLSSEK